MIKDMALFPKALFLIILVLISFQKLPAKQIDMDKVSIIVSPQITSPVRETVVKILKQEVTKRSSAEWESIDSWNTEKSSIVAVALTGDKKLFGKPVPERNDKSYPEYKSEGYRILTQKENGKNILWIIGADSRATVFGCGKLLRTIVMMDDNVHLDKPVDFAISPMQEIRGHQLGFRDKANSYDAWNGEQYEQYIRGLVLFGTNAIENIPFSEKGVHMPISPKKMNIRISEICASYGIDYWVWTPAGVDLGDKVKRQALLKKHEKLYRDCPKLDEVFVPGGDPGDNHPKLVMPFLKDLSHILTKYHPDAGVWLSLQGFSTEQINYFFNYLDKYQPEWLRGIVSGPGSPPIASTRHRLDSSYKHRHYPDITHNVRCQYPVKNWDQTYSLTIGREGINPQPYYYSSIHEKYASFTDGFVSYSDGCHDDVNKVVWSMRGWDIEKPVREILTEYCHFFFGPEIAETAAEGVFALEQNWVGPIIENGSIETTLKYWQELNKENPQLSDNWRWQMLGLRAHYDAYQRKRKIYEQVLEERANEVLAKAEKIGADNAMKKALDFVNKADSEPVAQTVYDRIVSYCDDLFHSCGLQTSVPKYKASGAERGCILQFANYPLNNRWWLADEFKKIGKMESEQEKLKRLKIIRTWENPGKGNYYDNISNITTGPRVLTTSYDATDVAWWNGGYSRARLSSQLFQNNPVLEYENLDFNECYLIRVCGQGEALLRADGRRLEPVLYNKGRGEFKEFIVPKSITRDGEMRITFDVPEESHLNWRDHSHVSDVWVIKR
jgi:hypothetical protein